MAIAHRDSEVAGVQEATPLLPSDVQKEEKQGNKLALYRALVCTFVVSLSFGVTQVPILYVFRLMTCDAYYKTHPSPPLVGVDRCSIREIEARTARAVSLLGASTTLFGILNLFVTGWTIKRFGVKPALMIQVFWAAARLSVQNFGVMTGSNAGILIMQASQAITVIGGPNGYVLALNSYVADVSGHEDRTGALGRLSGIMMVGSAVGFLLGGVIGEKFGILAPFRITLVLFLLSTFYIWISLPSIVQVKDVTAARQSTGFRRYFGPLRIFAPQKWILVNGNISTQFGALALGLGVYLAILATGYIPTLLQMYSTNEFGFGTAANGRLIFIYSSLRGLFLTLAFPRIISMGRAWLNPAVEYSTPGNKSQPWNPQEEEHLNHITTLPSEVEATDTVNNEAEPTPLPQRNSETETFAFDLLYARCSLFVDCVLTGIAVFVTQGWQLYLVAVLLPFGAGTASASKGTILQMIQSNERVDALSGITLVENLARLSTTAVFGLVFAALAETGKSEMTFVCNSAVAFLGFIVLLCSRFPPDGSRRPDE